MVQFLASNRIEGTEAERLALPVNSFNDGYTFLQLDSVAEYIWISPNWILLEPALSGFFDDMTQDKGWLTSDATTMNYNGAQQRMDVDYVRDSSNDSIAKDLQDANALNGNNASDTQWTLRWITTVDTNTASNQYLHAVISDSDQTVGQDQNQSYIGSHYITTDLWFSIDGLNTIIQSGGGGDNSYAGNLDNGVQYFNEVKRLSSTTYIASSYTDNTFAVTDGTATGTVDSGVIAGRYIKFCNRVVAASGAGIFTFVNQVDFFDGTSNP